MASSDSAILLSMGRDGSTVFSDTAAHTGPWCSITIVVASIFSAFNGDGMVGYVGPTFPVGHTILGPINSFTLTSGTVVAYFGTIA